jgi:hypothetical protein
MGFRLNNGFIDHSFTIIRNYNKLQNLTINLPPNPSSLTAEDSLHFDSDSESESECYNTTYGQSASLSWCQSPICGLRADFYYCQTVADLLIWGALSDERTGLPFSIAAGTHQSSNTWVRVPRTRDHILLSQIRDYPNLEGQFPVFISPGKRVAHLYPQALGSLSASVKWK